MKSIRIKISGKVRSVGFRFFVKQVALMHGLIGTVSYSGKDCLIIEASGNDPDLKELIDYCRIGSFGSVVDDIEVTEMPVKKYASFEIIEN